MRSHSARLETARTQTYARALLGLVVAVAAFGAGNFVHAQPGQESSPKSTARAADGGYRVVEFGRLLPRAPLPAGVESEPAAAPQIVAVSFSAVAGPVRWYPPRRLIDVTVKFDRAVTVNTAGGTPRIDLVLGTRLLRHAGYASGSGSPELIFQYVTGDWNQALSDIAVGASSLRLNGGRIDSLADAIAADLAHAAGRLDNVGARPDFAADNSFLVAASGTGAGANRVALPPAVLRTPLPGLNPDDGLVQSRSGHGLVGGQWTVPPVSGDPGAALASVTVRAQLQGLEPLLELSLFQQAISGSPWTAPATAAIAFAPGESRRATESALTDVRQYRVTPARDDVTAETSNTLRAAGTGVPPAPWLWPFVEGQTRIRLQWNRGNNTVINHQLEVCSEADALDCEEADDWTVLVEDHPQSPSPNGNAYTHTGLVPSSTRHYRVASRNANGLGDYSRVRSATTESRPTSMQCEGAFWSAYVTVATFGAYNDQGYRSYGSGALTKDAAGTVPDDGFSLGATTYMVNQLYYSHDHTMPTQVGRYYFPAAYHFALSHYPAPDDKIKDLTLYVGEMALPLSSAGHTLQGFGEAFRWGEGSRRWEEGMTSPYDSTFDYEDGDSVMVCITDSAPNVTLVLDPAPISEDGGVSTVTATVAQGVADPFEVAVSAEAESPATTADFTLSENTVLSFAANATTSSGAVTITAKNNHVDAAHKTILVRGAVSAGARPRAPQRVKLTIEDDDAAPVLSVAVDPAAIDEDGGVSQVVVSTGDTTFAAEQTITLTFTGSAEKDTDYRVSTEQLTLPASEHSVTAAVTAEDDTVDEADETILVSATHAGADVGTLQQITITDDEDEPELSITSDTVEEGESAEFEVTLNAASGQDVMVSYMTEDVTATAGADYDYTALPSTTLTFVAGETAKTLTVATADDTLHEQVETFSVTLSAATNATLEGGGNTLAGTGTINDNDVLPEVSIADATAVVEGAPAEFEVSLDVTSGSEVTVTYATGGTDDTAQSPEDYTAVESTTLTFAVGVQVKTITVATRNDDLDEEDGETFTVTLSAPGNAALATDGTMATGTIDDNDDEPKVSITGAPVVVEGTAATFVVELSVESRKTVTVSYETADGTALESEDYTKVAATTLEFRSGVTAQTISVATTVDGFDEADGETFTVTLSGPGNAELAAGGETATGTINDNDDPPEVSITGTPVVVEGTAATFVVELSAESRKTVTVSYETADGTALAGEDYPEVDATELEFRSGVTAQTISVATTADGFDEADGETFTVTLSAPGNAELATGGTTATGTINDNDDPPEVSITGTPVVVEGTAATFVVELSAESRKTVTVSYETADGTALKSEDYTAVALTELEFRSGVTAQTISVATTADGFDEADGETFTVTLSAPGNAALATDATTATATGTINDNDDPPEVSITGTPVVVEGTAATFVVELSVESRKTVTVSYKTADGTALKSEDYTAVALTELEFRSGVTAQTISVATTADGFDEADGETFTVTLSAPGNAALATDATTATATGTINDNDDPPEVSITGTPVVVEGTAATFVVELSAESRKTVTVSYETADGTALAGEDYPEVDATELEFRSGVTAQTISVATTADGFDEADGETFTVTLSAPGNAELATGGTTATGTINDNDDPPEVSITGTPVVVEGTAATFVVELSAESRKTVTVSYETADGTALKSEDYTAVALTELEFRSGVTAQTISVATTADGFDEADGETFTVTLSAPGNAALATDATTATATGTINDNDDPPEVSITGTPVVVEGTAATFVVELSVESRKTVTVSYETADGTALKSEDYTAVALTELEFRSGVTAQTISVATTADGVDEADGETFTVTLSAPVNAELATGAKTATGTIDDNDGAPEVSITGAPVVVEGTAASFVVELSGESRKTVTVSYATADGTALKSEDYTAVALTELEFRSGVTTQTISVATTADGLDEADGETFTVTLSAPGNAELATGAKTATGTINDNDDPPEVSITGTPVVVEGTAATFVVELSVESRKTVTVSYKTADGTALKSEDYTAVALTELEFRSGVTAQTISVATTVDGFDEADGETFTVTLSAPGNAALATDATTATATGTINDNDDPPEVSITGTPVVVEGTAATFVVELSVESRKTVTVSYATADGTALKSEDYTAVALTELEFRSGVTAQTISVATTADGVDEADGETFTVTLSAPVNAELATGGTTATGTINDNDDPPEVSITGTPVVVEGTAATFVVELSVESRKTVTVSYATADGTALKSEDYTAVALTELEFRSGVTAQTISVATTADGVDEADGETFTVTLSAPVNAELATGAKTATGTIDDNDGAPEVSITGAPVVVEGTAASFVVELSGESRKTVTVSYATADGTALKSEDYTAVALTELEFRSGVTTQTISVATTADGLDEADGETFTVTLSAPVNAELATGGTTATGTINDNDDPPEVSITGTPVVTEGTAASFVVELSGESRKTVTVSYETADGTALKSEDYTAVALTELEFTSGETVKTISVATTVDGLDEADGETFTVTLSAPGNAALATDATTARGTINDNDDEPKVSITGAPVVVEGTAASFVVELNGESRKTVTVSYKTADGTALESEDYTAVALTELEFTSGVTAQTISVATTVDGLDEADGETFTVTLSGPGNAELATGRETATGTINDNDDEPKVSITGAPVVVEGTAASFVVELSAESRKTVTVSYETADGTALASEDYTKVAATTLEFRSGVTAQTISVATTVDGWTRLTARRSR